MRARATAIAVLAALMLASCGGDGSSSDDAIAEPVVIGTKNFTESVILGELYGQALRAEGVSVELQRSVGSTEVINVALRDGLLDMYPEYIGVLLAEVHKIVKRPASAREAYGRAKNREEKRGFTLLEPTRLSNENALAVTRSFSRRRGARSIADLKTLRPRPLIGAAPEFQNRFEGLVGLRRRYGLTRPRFERVDTNKGRQYPLLESGRLDVALVYTTDPQLAGERYVLLSDPQGIFAEQHVAPLISQQILSEKGPRLARTLNAVSAVLTTPVMRRLNAEAADLSPAQVADRFLRARGLKG
ncbi:MAG: glycine betaine ABC transporter substrate-binding protein [Solirubrobacteraceae bacterium]